MNHWSRIAWIICILSFLILIGTRFILSGWDTLLSIPLFFFLGSLLWAFIADLPFYTHICKKRSTKYGLHMGVMLILFLAGLVAINVISVRHNASWDITEEKINSLSQATLEVLGQLGQDIQLTIFYAGTEAQEARLNIKFLIEKYQSHSPRLKSRFIDAYVHTQKANEYLESSPISGLTIVMELKRENQGKEPKSGPSIELSAPIDEEKLTLALIRLTRKESKKVYFLSGHDERSINEENAHGITSFATSLRKMSFDVATLNLFDTKVIPTDADVLAIVGPQSPYLLSEKIAIEKFLRKGGGLMVAVDPNMEHQMEDWLRAWGVGYKNNLVVSPFVVISGRGQTSTAGRIYSHSHEVTKKNRPDFTHYF